MFTLMTELNETRVCSNDSEPGWAHGPDSTGVSPGFTI